MDQDLEQFIDQQKRDYGDQSIEEAGLPWLAEVYPERLRHFIGDCKLDYDVSSLPRKTLELVLLSACLALRNTNGIRVHTQGCLSAGATQREILDVMFAVAAAASHNISVNDISIIKPILDTTKK